MSTIQAAEALDIARAVARDAAALLRGAAGNIASVRSKSADTDLVTEWDTRCEELVRERLHALTPRIPLLGEESGAMPAHAGDSDHDHVWVVDPIDGTVNFVHGVPIFAVAISLEHHGRAVAGVVHAPMLGWEFYGHRGGGAFMNGERMAVSRTDSLGRSLLTTGFPYDRATRPDNNFAEWEHMQRKAGACRRFGAASLDLCMVARGWCDGYWERHVHAWDISAGALLVEEAGGTVTLIDGSPFQSANGEVLATNGAIHGLVMHELAAVL